MTFDHAARAVRPRRGWATAFIVAAGLLSVAILATAQGASATAVPYGKGLLWRIERPGVTASHLFGTLHSTDPRVTTLPDAVNKVLANAHSLALEVVQTKETPVEMARAMVLPRDRRLDAILGPALFDKLAAIAKRRGLPTQALVRLKPWAASTAISIPPEETAGAAAGRQRLDHALQLWAQERGIPVHGLETVDEQLAMFDGLSEQDQITMLKRAVADSPRLTEFVETMKRYYLARDLAALLAWMEKQSAGENARLARIFKERIVDGRNRTMAQRMTARLDEGGAFIAIGAAHLPGTKGVLNLLAQRGWRITRIY